MNTETLNFACMKWGTLYTAEDVNILYRRVKKNTSAPIRFVCYTENADGIDPGIEAYPIPELKVFQTLKKPRNTYLKKMLCSADLKPFTTGDRFLYMDIDVVIAGPLDDFFTYKPEADFAIIYNWTRGNGQIGNSSVTRFTVGPLQYVVDDMEAHLVKRIAQYKTASQEYLSAMIIQKYGKLEFWPDHWVRSFQIHSMPPHLLRLFKDPVPPPPDCRILVFHGAVKPKDAIAGRWPRHVSLWKKWYKTVRPCPWLSKFLDV